jgi:hypothetical protein
METDREMEVHLHLFLISAEDACEWEVGAPNFFSSMKHTSRATG